MAELVYTLCFLTSLLCAGLLTRSYLVSRTRLLLWSSVCFAGFALNNGLLLAELLYPELDLAMARALIALAATTTLVFGLIRDVH